MILDGIKTPKALEEIIHFYKRGYSPILVFTGEMRCGKTSKAFLIAQWLSWIIFNKKWDWESNTISNLKQFVQKIDSSEEEILFLDEVQGFLASKEWYSPNNIIFNKLMMSQAYKHMIFILVLPYALGMAKDHRRLIHMLFWVKNRRNVYPVLYKKKFWSLEETPSNFFFYPIIPLNYKTALIKKHFSDEIEELKIFKKHIEVVVKQGILNSAKEKVGLDIQPFHRCLAKNCYNTNAKEVEPNVWLCSDHFIGRDTWD